jgi:acyl-CoA reductase-like NAD-dependent aldehyde dehydrogenase
LGEVAAGGVEEVDSAVAAAVAAFPAWAAAGPRGRMNVLRAFAKLIAERAEEFITVECLNTGMLMTAVRNLVTTRVPENINYFADLAVGHEGPVFESPNDHEYRVRFDPAGVAALISPFNGPLLLGTFKLGAALAAGDTVVMKPPEWAPLSSALLAEVADAAGFPPGVLNVVQGYGEQAGRALAAHGGVARISFTGSPETARLIAAASAPNLVPLQLELGGKSPFIVFGDADLAAAAAGLVAQYFHATQVCSAGTRVLVDEAIAAEFVERVRERVVALKIGDPREADTAVGPLIHHEHFEKVAGFVDRARGEGARVLCGGRPAPRGGLYYEPTLVADVNGGMEIWRREVFGPVLVVDTFADVEEAIRKANDSDYGLAAHVWTSSQRYAALVAEQLVAGTVLINASRPGRHMAAPSGGARSSGIGREGGMWSLEFFSEVKTVVTRRQTLEAP